ncbi:AMP-binding protein [Polynucleobacter sp. CS-Odin-A6]|uniref:AMP-binding protein n=1 Tax=Polynucleobacter sp. CS-Odin-A6 TaxID=2689106 RepID=UPI001C0ADED0|nr:AMP-binding protein [Polynucleobacter sp. CS-Odin-A6]MBU3620241.1 AMP-binding protein [Polynucleobacter sp. CS-Odin-A6]
MIRSEIEPSPLYTAGYAHLALFDSMNVYQKVMAGANINLAAPAFISHQGAMTYGQFVSLVALSAKGLHHAGIGKGVVVGICMDHSALHAAVIVALAQLGAVSVGLPPQTPTDVLTKTITRFGVEFIIRGSEVPEIAGIKNIQFGKISFAEGEHVFNVVDHGLTEPQAEDSARFMLTSGTTGECQALLYTQASWIERVDKTVDALDQNSRVICPDMSSILGNVFLLGSLFAGGAIVLARMNTYAELMTDLSTYAATHVLLPPHILHGMTPYLPKQGIVFPWIRHLRPFGSGLSESLVSTLLSRISPNVYFPYGITEVGAIAIATPAMLKEYPGTSGKVKAWSKAQVIDEQDNILPAGEVGRLRVQVAGMVTEYYKDPMLSKERFKDGWFYTSDQGYIDKNGYLFVQGRMDDLVNLDGLKFNPIEVESQIINHSDITECAVFAIDVEGAKVLCGAFVASEEKIIKALASNPNEQALLQERYFSVDSLPRNNNGKILRKDLPTVFANQVAQILQQQSSSGSNLPSAIDPNVLEAAKAANHRAIALTEQNDFLGALKEFDQALAIYPQFLDALNNKSAALLATGQTIKAKACALTALDIEPRFDAVRINLAFAQLKLGEFKEGWKNYDYRWSVSSEAVSGKLQRFSTNLPNWRGESNTQKQNLVVITEQGYGDVFQFSRYLPLLKQRFAKVGFASSKETYQVLLDSFGDQISIIGNTQELQQGWHWQCDLMSLPLAMGTELHTIPCEAPYLKTSAQKKAFWQERLAKAKTQKKRIGIAWMGRSSHQFDRLRSMAFQDLAPLFEIEDITWVSLQKEANDIPSSNQMPKGKWLDWTAELEDFSDTAALISNLDLVVSIDSSMVHLAGGLNTPVALLNRYAGEWRWLEHTDETPWYPNTHIFTQPRLGNWQTPLAELKAALQKMM